MCLFMASASSPTPGVCRAEVTHESGEFCPSVWPRRATLSCEGCMRPVLWGYKHNGFQSWATGTGCYQSHSFACYFLYICSLHFSNSPRWFFKQTHTHTNTHTHTLSHTHTHTHTHTH